MKPRYQVQPTEYGVLMEVGGFVGPDEISALDSDLERAVRGLPEAFGIVLDMRAAPAFSVEAAERLKRQLDVCREHGMARGAIVLESAILAIQARRIASEVGLLPKIRFLEASDGNSWEDAAIAWVERGEEPPKETGGEG